MVPHVSTVRLVVEDVVTVIAQTKHVKSKVNIRLTPIYKGITINREILWLDFMQNLILEVLDGYLH